VSELELLLAISSGLPPARRDRLTSIADELGRNISYEEAVGYFIEGFRSHFKRDFEPLILTAADLDRIKVLELAKYANPDWTLRKLAPVSI